MREAVRSLEKAIASQGGVLLCGEPHTGREQFARAIHHATHNGYDRASARLLDSPRRDESPQRFVVIDCCTVSSALERRLFGCVAQVLPDRVGDLERVGEGSALHHAIGGTLFLQHLPEMPGRLQARLARVFRDGEIWLQQAAGVPMLVRAPIRPIATTDARQGDADERILPHLRSRISQTVIHVPPLRARREDVPALVRHLLADICASRQMAAKSASTQAATLLSALPWRGNLRELTELLDRLVESVPGPLIRLTDVLTHVRLDGGAVALTYGHSLKEARARFEREYVASTLEQHQGRVADTARALGIQRTNLYRKLRQLSVQRRSQEQGR
jgi:two-component system response regulator AtoC